MINEKYIKKLLKKLFIEVNDKEISLIKNEFFTFANNLKLFNKIDVKNVKPLYTLSHEIYSQDIMKIHPDKSLDKNKLIMNLNEYTNINNE